MTTNFNPIYIHNGEITDFSFFRIPRVLVKDERFRDLSTDSKLLYGLMLNRMGLSLQNGWQDTEGYAFIYFHPGGNSSHPLLRPQQGHSSDGRAGAVRPNRTGEAGPGQAR